MSINLHRDNLLDPLTRALGAVSKHHTIPILSCARIVADGSTLRVTAGDTETGISSTIEVVTEPFALCVDARALADALRLIPDGAPISLEIQDGFCILRHARSRRKIPTFPPAEYPAFDPGPAILEISLDAQALASAIGQVAYAMGRNDVRYYLNGLLFDVGAQLTLVASDGHRLAKIEVAARRDREATASIIVPRNAVAELGKLLKGAGDDDVKIVVHQDSIVASLPGADLTAQLIEGKFPDWRRVVPDAEFDAEFTADSAMLSTTVRRASLNGGSYRAIKFDLADAALSLSARDGSGNEAADEIIVDCDGEIHTGFNPDYLAAAVDLCTPTANIAMLSNVTRITPPPPSTAVHIVMPIKI